MAHAVGVANPVLAMPLYIGDGKKTSYLIKLTNRIFILSKIVSLLVGKKHRSVIAADFRNY